LGGSSTTTGVPTWVLTDLTKGKGGVGGKAGGAHGKLGQDLNIINNFLTSPGGVGKKGGVSGIGQKTIGVKGEGDLVGPFPRKDPLDQGRGDLLTLVGHPRKGPLEGRGGKLPHRPALDKGRGKEKGGKGLKDLGGVGNTKKTVVGPN
jgi:hypothetical protein